MLRNLYFCRTIWRYYSIGTVKPSIRLDAWRIRGVEWAHYRHPLYEYVDSTIPLKVSMIFPCTLVVEVGHAELLM